MKIGEAFQKAGLITPDALEMALKEQELTHARLGDIILRSGKVTPDQAAPVLADYFNTQYVKLDDIYRDIEEEVIKRVPEELARRFTLIPIEIKDQVMVVAIFDPLNLVAIDTLRNKTGYKIRCVVASENKIADASLRSPVNGQVTDVKKRVGEVVQVETVFTWCLPSVGSLCVLWGVSPDRKAGSLES